MSASTAICASTAGARANRAEGALLPFDGKITGKSFDSGPVAPGHLLKKRCESICCRPILVARLNGKFSGRTGKIFAVTGKPQELPGKLAAKGMAAHDPRA